MRHERKRILYDEEILEQSAGLPTEAHIDVESMDELIRLFGVFDENLDILRAETGADIRAAECLVSFSHTRPNGDTCFSIANEFDMSGQNAWSGGENIAMGQITPDEAMTSWMNSPGHRSNILNASFNSVIVGVTPVKGVPGYSGYVWVQYFFY